MDLSVLVQCRRVQCHGAQWRQLSQCHCGGWNGFGAAACMHAFFILLKLSLNAMHARAKYHLRTQKPNARARIRCTHHRTTSSLVTQSSLHTCIDTVFRRVGAPNQIVCAMAYLLKLSTGHGQSHWQAKLTGRHFHVSPGYIYKAGSFRVRGRVHVRGIVSAQPGAVLKPQGLSIHVWSSQHCIDNDITMSCTVCIDTVLGL